jgi:hypothetical protein
MLALCISDGVTNCAACDFNDIVHVHLLSIIFSSRQDEYNKQRKRQVESIVQSDEMD